MKVLVVGNGGREHAIAWRLIQDETIQVTCVPGNGGTATLPRCRNLELLQTDFEGIARFCVVNNVGLVIVGPEAPLSEGIADFLREKNIPVFGPSRAGAQIEASKAWAKALMEAAHIPTARAAVFTDLAAAKAYVQIEGTPIVIKADGLAAGKGVTVAETIEQAEAALEACFSGQFGSAGSRVVIEECLIGQEASILAVTDGKTIRPLLPAQDHKRIGEGDTGENTGGMGVYAPAPVVTPEILALVQQQVLEPTIAALQARDIPYCGILYAGLMITPAGDPKVIEFNCRFGDPETQAVLPLLEGSFHKLLLACAQGKLADFPPLTWKPEVCACVVAASGGYPAAYQKGFPITGIDTAEQEGAIVFHAGTAVRQGKLVSDGGRVLGVTAVGNDFDDACDRAYHALEAIHFEGMYFRRDIGYRVRSKI
ncbi:MAG: phosphoribosylamine--glycine ligase [Synechococcales bacterium]|nr:phosphoribosylamine--glycine ligase [Synechococcales bacterium]